MNTPSRIALALLTVGWPAVAQSQESKQDRRDAPAAGSGPQSSGTFVVRAGTRVFLALTHNVSTKQAAPGDHVYLESVFPVTVDGRVVIPAGSHVFSTVTESRRPGRVKGRGALSIRFDWIILPNGVTRDLRARVDALDTRASAELDHKNNQISGKGNKSGDARSVGTAADIGGTVGASSGEGLGAAIGWVAGTVGGAAAGLTQVLVSRGPDAALARGTQLEMVLDRDLSFTEAEIQFPEAP